jgi:hypothetical protein
LLPGEARLWTYRVPSEQFAAAFAATYAGVDSLSAALANPARRDFSSYSRVNRPYRYIVLYNTSFHDADDVRNTRGSLERTQALSSAVGAGRSNSHAQAPDRRRKARPLSGVPPKIATTPSPAATASAQSAASPARRRGLTAKLGRRTPPYFYFSVCHAGVWRLRRRTNPNLGGVLRLSLLAPKIDAATFCYCDERHNQRRHATYPGLATALAGQLTVA